jgi:hypothetical protein
MPRPRSALTEFILSLPADVPVKEVIEKAKEKGYETSESNVSRVRQMAAAKGEKGPGEARPTASTEGAPEAPATSTATSMSGTDFIRNQPLDVSPAVVVAMAKAQGITISDSLVRKVRGPQGKKPRTSTPRKAQDAKKIVAPKKAPAASKAPAPEFAPMSKSDFIRQQPVTMSVADVIAAGKKAGLTFAGNLVYLARGRMGGTTTPRKVEPRKTGAAPKAPAAKGSPPKPAASAMSKADFVRSNPGLSAKEMVQKAKVEGLRFDQHYVYRVRAIAKDWAKKQTVGRRPASAPVVTTPETPKTTSMPPVEPVAVSMPAPTSASSRSTLEDLLRAVAAELGLGRAVEMLEGERTRIRGLIGG